MSQNKFRKIICWLFGHRSICLSFDRTIVCDKPWSTNSAYKCERCGHFEQFNWDN